MSAQNQSTLAGEKYTTVLQWFQASTQLSTLKKTEKKLRKVVCSMLFNGARAGTHKVELGSGYELKAFVKTNYAVKPIDGSYAYIIPLLDKLPTHIANELIDWNPKLSVTAYNNLTTDEQAIANEFLTITEGEAALTVVAPKQDNAG